MIPIWWGRRAKNRARVITIRDGAETAVSALATLFTDAAMLDDGTVPGRVQAILMATEHRFVPGLHTGAVIGLTGFKPEYQDPWHNSTDQVGHFLTAVRLAFSPHFLRNPVFPLVLGGFGHRDMPLRLVIGHEKYPDPPNIENLSLQLIFTVLKCFRAQYQSTTEADIHHFLAGELDKIAIANGTGNSMADLRLSYKGWQFGQGVRQGQFQHNEQLAQWVQQELAA